MGHESREEKDTTHHRNILFYLGFTHNS